jgi:hypothetical protein
MYQRGGNQQDRTVPLVGACCATDSHPGAAICEQASAGDKKRSLIRYLAINDPAVCLMLPVERTAWLCLLLSSGRFVASLRYFHL